jgi:hypothetical protein
VSTGTRGLESEGDVDLFARTDLEELPLAVLQSATAAIEIHGHAGINQLAMLLQQKSRPIGISARLLIGREGNDDVARRHIMLALEADQSLEQRGVPIFHILGAAPIEPAVFFRELEGIR